MKTWIGRLLLLGFLASSSASTSALAVEPVNLLRLRDAVCDQVETLGHPRPAFAVGDNGKAWGVCQVRYKTAVRVGAFPRDANPGLLFDATVNRTVALNVLYWCWKERGRRTVAGLAACYNSPSLPYPPVGTPLRAYAEKVLTAYSTQTR